MYNVTENVSMNINESTKVIVKGFSISIIFTLILLFVFAIIMSFTEFSENNITPVIIGVTAISILIGTSISTLKLNKNGMIMGGVIGFTYIFTLYLISSIVGTGFSLNSNAIIMIILGILAGMMGGIIGVNIKK